MVEGDVDTRKFSADELRDLFQPNFDTRSTCHDSLECECCDPVKNPTGKPGEDENGFFHLLPGSKNLRRCDGCLCAVKDNISLVMMKVTDHSGQAPTVET